MKRKIVASLLVCVLICSVSLTGCATRKNGISQKSANSDIEIFNYKVNGKDVIMVYIEDEATDADKSKLENDINTLDNIQKVEFVSKESAWEEQLSTMGDAESEFFQEYSNKIPLLDAYKVTVKNLTKREETVSSIKKLKSVDTVR